MSKFTFLSIPKLLIVFTLVVCCTSINAQPRAYNIINLNEEKHQNIDLKELIKKYKGKVIFIDFWATYCQPCIKEFPYVKELQKQLRKEKFEIVFISTDRNAYQWETTIKKFQIYGDHYLANPKIKEDVKKKLNLVSIPRYVLINKKGRIVDKDAEEPSDTKLIEEIKTIL